MTQTPQPHWSEYARKWSLLGSPLRPCAEDVLFVSQQAREHMREGGRALLLGVTPELASMSWPARTRLDALERNPDMIAAVFPRSGVPAASTATEGDWLEMPYGDASFDFIVGDGCLTTLAFPGGYRAMAAACARVLAPDARMTMRLFVSPENPETPSDVARDLEAGQIGNFHVLKWRLAMAVWAEQGRDGGVRLGAIHDAFGRLFPDAADLARAHKWQPEVVRTIEAYRDAEAHYSFPTLGEVCNLFEATFDVVAWHTPKYELGDRCPTLVLCPKRR